MKKVVLIFWLFLMCFATQAFCKEVPYLSINAGLSMLSDSDWTDDTVPNVSAKLEYDMGFAGGIAVGYAFNNNFRVEGELAYQKNDLDKVTLSGVSLSMDGDTTVLAFLVNGYYDFANNSDFTPFISAGVGYAKFELNDFNVTGSGLPNISDNDRVFAYQFGAGIGYAVTDTVTLDLKYRFFGTQDPKLRTANYECTSHNLYLGLRFNF